MSDFTLLSRVQMRRIEPFSRVRRACRALTTDGW